jgi:HK97 family phage portal protein
VSLFFRAAEQRSLSYQDVWGSGGTVPTDIVQGGSNVAESGLRLIPVYAATSLIADLVSTAPLRVFREAADGTRTMLPTQPQLVTNPAPYGTRIDWIHQAMTSLLLRGNAYGYITNIDWQGRPSQIQWLNPDDVTVVEEQQDFFHWPTYYWRGREIDRDLVVHIPAFTFPGSVVGYSPLALFKLQIETGLRAQKHGDDWFKNGAQPSGQLRNQQRTITPDEADTVKKRYKSAIAKRDVFVTGADWDYAALSVNADESQFLQTIKANATQVAAIYRVSPEDVGGETATSLTYKTLEQDDTKLTKRTLGVWCGRLEASLTNLLPRPHFAQFDLDKLARGDLTSRMVAETAALSAGIHTLDESRASENLPPLTPEQVQQWQEWYRTAAAMPGTPNPNAPAPKKGLDGGPNA